MAKKNILLLYFLIACTVLQAQDSLLLQLEDSIAQQGWAQAASGTFKATQIINTPTVEAPAKGSLQFMIMHRFGKLNEGAYALFGLDNATIRFALDYGLTDQLAIGVGRSSFEKVFDGSVKWKVVQQKERGTPLSMSLYGLVTHTTLRQPDKPYLNTKYKTAYTTQLLIARKFSSRFSMQLTPSWIHFNLVPTPEDKNEVGAIGLGGRLKVTKRMSINAEYNYLLPDQVVTTDVFNSLSLGIDLETGGHVFQLVFTNAQGMTAPYYLAKTTGRWGNGDIYFGFNITRLFQLKK